MPSVFRHVFIDFSIFCFSLHTDYSCMNFHECFQKLPHVFLQTFADLQQTYNGRGIQLVVVNCVLYSGPLIMNEIVQNRDMMTSVAWIHASSTLIWLSKCSFGYFFSIEIICAFWFKYKVLLGNTCMFCIRSLPFRDRC